MATALILAGSSFIGRHLAARLRRDGHEVAATTRRPLHGFLHCDLTDFDEVDRVIAATTPRWIIQCAGATTSRARAEMDGLHVGGTVHVLQAAARYVPNSPVLLFGSAAEYGNVRPSGLPVREDYPPQPQSAFGRSKLAQLRVAEEAAFEHNLRVLMLRPFNVLGPGLPEHYLAGALARRLWEARALDERGAFPISNWQATRDWVDVRDVTDAVTGLLRDALPSPGCVDVYNVATGVETPVLTVADQLCRLTGVFSAARGTEVPSRSHIMRSCGDASRLHDAIGWRPRIAWQQSLREMWDALPASDWSVQAKSSPRTPRSSSKQTALAN